MSEDRHFIWRQKAQALQRQFQTANIPDMPLPAMSGGPNSWSNYTPEAAEKIRARMRQGTADIERLNFLNAAAGNLLSENPAVALAAGVSNRTLSEQYPAARWYKARTEIIGTEASGDSAQIQAAVAALEVLIGVSHSKPKHPSARANTGAGGRPRVLEQDEHKRNQLIEAWRRAKSAGTSKKDFCVDNGISPPTLDTYLDWHAKRHKRGR